MINVKLKYWLKVRGYTQKQFAEITGLREATISELANNQRSAINKDHLVIVMKALKLNKIEDILEVIGL